MKTEYLVIGGFLAWLLLAKRKHNPCRSRRQNPGDPELRTALEQSQRFHGSNQVIQLSDKERTLPEYVVALGYLPELTYEPRPSSNRGDTVWEHKAGDRGPFRTPGKGRPVLAADPKTGRPLIVNMRSGMKFEPDRGLVG